MAGEMPVRVAGLREAVLLSARSKVPMRVIVEQVELRHAPALEALFAKATREWGWIVLPSIKLGHLSRLSSEIDAVLYAVLPMLKDNPRDADASRLLQEYGWSIIHISRKVDGDTGPFHGDAAPVGSFIQRHATHLHKGDRSFEWLRGNIPNMREKLEDLKSVVVFLPYGGGGGGDDDDDGGDGDGGDGNGGDGNGGGPHGAEPVVEGAQVDEEEATDK